MQKPARPPIGLLVANTAKALSRAFNDTLAAAGGSMPVWVVLMTLKNQPTASQREIAAAVGIQGATLTHHLNAMEKDGLITRTRDPDNRRVHQVRLTDRGEALFHRLTGAAHAHDKRLRADLSEDDVETLEKLLTRMRANVTE